MDELVISTGYMDIGLDSDFDVEKPPEERRVKALKNLTSHEVFILMHSFENLPPTYLAFFSRDDISGKEIARIQAVSDFSRLGITMSREWELSMYTFIMNLKSHGVPMEKLESCQSIPVVLQGTVQDSLTALKEAMSSKNDIFLIEKAFDVICNTIKDNKTLQQIFGSIYKIETNIIKLAKICLPSFILCSKICKVIHLFAFENDVNNAKIGGAGACELISSILKSHIHVEVIRETAAIAIRSLSYNSTDNIKKLQTAGCVELIVKALQMSTECASVARVICFSIRNLAVDVEIRKSMGDLGVCDTLSKVLATFRNNISFVEAAALAVFNLSFTESNRQKLFRGCGSVIVPCLTLHMSSPETTSAVCRAIYIFSHKDKAASIAMVEIGVSAAVITAIVAHQEIAAVVEWGLKAFISLSTESNETMSLVTHSGACEAFVRVLQSHESNPNIIAICCRAISLLAIDSASNITRMCNVSATTVMLSLLTKHSSQASACEWCCRALFEMSSRDDSCRLQLVTQDCGPTAVSVIQAQLQSPTALEAAFRLLCALTKFSKDDTVSEALGSLGLCELVVLSLWNHLGKAELVHAGSDIITALAASNDRNSMALSAVCVCDAVLFGVRVHKASPVVVRAACDAMFVLIRQHKTTSTPMAASCPDNAQILFNSGLCECLVAIMRIHLESKPVLVSIMRVVQQVVGSNTEHAIRLQSLGISRLVLYSMKHHRDDVKVVVGACNVIKNISHNETMCASLVESNVCESLMGVLDTLSSSAAGVEAFCATVFNLSLSDSTRQKLGDAGVCEVVVGFLRTYIMSSEEVITNSCKAVCMLSSKSESNNTRFGKCGAVMHVLSAIETHPNLPGLLEWALKALSNLATDHEGNTEVTCSAHSLSTIIQAVMNHMHVVGIVEWVCRLVSYLGDTCPRYRDDLGRAGYCDLVVGVLRIHLSMFNIAGWCMRAICALATDTETNMKALRKADAFEMCVRVLQMHNSVPGAVEWSCQATLVLGVNATNYRFGLLPSETLETLVTLSRSYLNNASIISLICRVIRRLADDIQTSTRFGELGCCEAMITALLAHMMTASAVERILFVICILTNVDGNRSRLGAAGACESVIQALKQHCNVVTIVICGCRAVTKLSQHSADNRDRFVYAQAKRLIGDILNHPAIGEQAKTEAREALRVL